MSRLNKNQNKCPDQTRCPDFRVSTFRGSTVPASVGGGDIQGVWFVLHGGSYVFWFHRHRGRPTLTSQRNTLNLLTPPPPVRNPSPTTITTTTTTMNHQRKATPSMPRPPRCSSATVDRTTSPISGSRRKSRNLITRRLVLPYPWKPRASTRLHHHHRQQPTAAKVTARGQSLAGKRRERPPR